MSSPNVACGPSTGKALAALPLAGLAVPLRREHGRQLTGLFVGAAGDLREEQVAHRLREVPDQLGPGDAECEFRR